MSEHTPEPWVAVRNTAYWEIGTEIDGYYAARIGDVCATDPNHPDAGKQEANANRIVACVNACAGMADPAAEITRLRARVAELEAAANQLPFVVRHANSGSIVAAFSYPDIAQGWIQRGYQIGHWQPKMLRLEPARAANEEIEQ